MTNKDQRYAPLNYSDIYEVIEGLLHLFPEDLEAIQMHSPNHREEKLTRVLNSSDLYALAEVPMDSNNGGPSDPTRAAPGPPLTGRVGPHGVLMPGK